MQAIKTVQLTKKYKDITAVDSLDLTVEQGELFALLGVNGAGKTTTIKMLTCLTKPDSGNVFVNGNSIITDVAAVKSIIGVSPQETAVAPNLSAGKLSGGWQRRLSIAMALISEPQILFLDEPTLGLDVLARSDLWDTIRTLKGKITIILTTHYMEEAEALADRIGIMKDGKLLALGTAEALKAKAGTEKFEDAFVAIVKGSKKL